jgi:hypothetical protein
MSAGLAAFRRLPQWVPVILGLACVAVGVVLVLRPFTSLSVLAALAAAALLVTGVMELAAILASPSGAITVVTGLGWLVAAAQSLALDKPIFTGNPATGALGQRLVQNTPAADVQAPLLIAQGLADPLVLPSVQAQYVRQRCAAGQKLDYLTYPDQDHVGADSPLIPALISWTKNRLAGKPAPDTCATP